MILYISELTDSPGMHISECILKQKKEVEKPKVSVNSEDEGQESEVEKHADTDSHWYSSIHVVDKICYQQDYLKSKEKRP